MPRVFLIVGSLHPVVIQLCVETDDYAILDPVGWGAQVAARPHGLLQDFLLLLRHCGKVLYLLPLGDSYGLGCSQQFPGGLFVKAGLLGVDDFLGGNLSGLKKLLSIFTGGSALAQVGPVDLHSFFLSFWIV
jgi:hypothetical protein